MEVKIKKIISLADLILTSGLSKRNFIEKKIEMEVKIKKINILAVLDFWTKKEKFHKKR